MQMMHFAALADQLSIPTFTAGEVRAVKSISAMSFHKERQMLHWLPAFFTSEKLKFRIKNRIFAT